MNAQLTLDQAYVELPEFCDTADEVTGAGVQPGVSCQACRPVDRATSYRSPDWMPLSMRQLDAIERLPVGWDSHGASQPDERIVRSARALLAALVQASDRIPKPRINPTPTGGVQFDWERGARYCEIELVDPRNAQFYFVDHEAKTECNGRLRAGDYVDEIVECVIRAGIER